MSAAQEAAPGWTPEELWVIAFGERLLASSDSAGLGRRREEIAHAELGGKIAPETAVALVAEVRKRRDRMFADLRNRHDRPTLFEARQARQGHRTFTPRSFPAAETAEAAQ
jgi:hypothetical protein